MKKCTKCGIEKPLDEFYKAAGCVDGRHGSCKECYRGVERKRYSENRTDRLLQKETYLSRANELRRERYKDPETRERVLERRKEWGRNNRDIVNASRRRWYKTADKSQFRRQDAARRARLKQATPSWSGTEFEQFAIAEIYDLAVVREKETGIKWHVDHIIPLQNDLVCGLHCAANLQVITWQENLSKGNKFDANRS